MPRKTKGGKGLRKAMGAAQRLNARRGAKALKRAEAAAGRPKRASAAALARAKRQASPTGRAPSEPNSQSIAPKMAEGALIREAAVKALEKHAPIPKHDDAPQASRTSAEELARLDAMGLREVPVFGTHLHLVGLKDSMAAPSTLEQRVEMAKRLNEVGPGLPKYVQTRINIDQPEKSVDAATAAALAGVPANKGENVKKPSKPVVSTVKLDTKEIEQAFHSSNAEVRKREAQAKKDAEKKLKEEEAARKKKAAAAKKLKGMDVTPKGDPKKAGGHNWVKQNLVSNKDGSDDYMCENCEKKFKRRGLAWNAPAGDCKKAQPDKKGKAAPAKAAAAAGGTGKGIGGLCRRLLLEGKSTEDILKEVKKEHPSAKTTAASIAWYRSEMRGDGRLKKD